MIVEEAAAESKAADQFTTPPSPWKRVLWGIKVPVKSSSQRAAIAVLAEACDKNSLNTYAGIQTIADRMGCTYKPALKALKELEALGLIRIEETEEWGTNLYTILYHENPLPTPAKKGKRKGKTFGDSPKVGFGESTETFGESTETFGESTDNPSSYPGVYPGFKGKTLISSEIGGKKGPIEPEVLSPPSGVENIGHTLASMEIGRDYSVSSPAPESGFKVTMVKRDYRDFRRMGLKHKEALADACAVNGITVEEWEAANHEH